MRLKEFILKRKIKLVQLADIIIYDMNIQRNDIVMIHPSLKYMTLTDSTPEDLIYLLKMIVGAKGTLLMPAFSADNRNPGSSPDVKSDFIRNDIIDLFSRMSDTIHCSNVTESFVVWGGMAKTITEENSGSGDESEENVLIKKLARMKAKIIGIGIPVTDYFLQYSVVKTADEISEEVTSGELKAFKKRGIPFFRAKAEKVYQIINPQPSIV